MVTTTTSTNPMINLRGCRGCHRMVIVQSVPITTKVVRLNSVHGEVYLIQYYVKKLVRELWQVGAFFWVLNFSTNKTDHYDITEILLKVVLNTIKHTKPSDKPQPPKTVELTTKIWSHPLTNLKLLNQYN